jgi:hypothetical protein
MTGAELGMGMQDPDAGLIQEQGPANKTK